MTYHVIGADGREYGPVTVVQLRQWLVAGRVHGTTSVRMEGSTEWRPLAALPEFGGTVSGAPPITPLQPAPLIPFYRRRTNPWATAGLVMGILSITLGLCCCNGFPFNLLGILFSIIALAQIRDHRDTETGSAQAWVGLILSLLSIALGILMAGVGLAVNWEEIANELERI